jgi:hypothetical protein
MQVSDSEIFLNKSTGLVCAGANSQARLTNTCTQSNYADGVHAYSGGLVTIRGGTSTIHGDSSTIYKDPSTIYRGDNPTIRRDSSTIRQNNSCGVRCVGSGTVVECSGVCIAGNAGEGLAVYSGGRLVVKYCSLEKNKGSGVLGHGKQYVCVSMYI